MHFTAQKMKFSVKNFFSKCDQIRRFLRIWSHLLKKSLMENFIFCAVLFWTKLSLTQLIQLTHNLKLRSLYMALYSESIFISFQYVF